MSQTRWSETADGRKTALLVPASQAAETVMTAVPSAFLDAHPTRAVHVFALVLRPRRTIAVAAATAAFALTANAVPTADAADATATVGAAGSALRRAIAAAYLAVAVEPLAARRLDVVRRYVSLAAYLAFRGTGWAAADVLYAVCVAAVVWDLAALPVDPTTVRV